MPIAREYLVAFGADVPKGRVLERVDAIDIAPTILALLGVSVPNWMQGRPISAFSYPGSQATNEAISAKLTECNPDAYETVP